MIAESTSGEARLEDAPKNRRQWPMVGLHCAWPKQHGSCERPKRHRNPEDPAKKAMRQRRHSLRKQQTANPNAILWTRCRQCNKEIKPSYERAFCPGGECRREFFSVVQITRFVPITHPVSDPLTLSLLPVKVAARVVAEDEGHVSRKQEPLTGLNLVHGRRELSAVPVVTERTKPVTALNVLFPFDEPIFAINAPVDFTLASRADKKNDRREGLSRWTGLGYEVRRPSMRINLLASTFSVPGVNRREGIRPRKTKRLKRWLSREEAIA